MKVSHAYRDTSPQHEVIADVGLMLYGNGTEIPPGREGRFNRERLHRSPYVYRFDDSGERNYEPDYATDGFYYDGSTKASVWRLIHPSHDRSDSSCCPDPEETRIGAERQGMGRGWYRSSNPRC